MSRKKYDFKNLHTDLFAMAAAYAFYLCQNHPFVDGNKRSALTAALVFLDMNGIAISDTRGILFDAMMTVATGEKDKRFLADILRDLSE